MAIGILFDLDGTLADTEPLQWRAYRTVLQAHGHDVDQDTYRRHWIAVDGGPEWACRTFGLPFDASEFRRLKAIEYRRLIAAGVPPCRGACEAVRRLRVDHRVAIATNTVRHEIGVVLGHLGLDGQFHTIVGREDYAHPKPAPDAYLAAAAALGLSPSSCLVVEDTQRGLHAGLAAGMRVVVVPNALTFDNDFTGAAERLASLDDLTTAVVRDLLPAA